LREWGVTDINRIGRADHQFGLGSSALHDGGGCAMRDGGKLWV
jgi:hypothetical protein